MVVFKKGNSIKNMLGETDQREITEINNVVYNIKCQDCDSVYVGTTKRKLKTRINEHKKAFTNFSFKSNVADHAIKLNHNINWEEPRITYSDNGFRSRYFLESCGIEKNKLKGRPLMNDQQNTKTCVPSQYLSLMQ